MKEINLILFLIFSLFSCQNEKKIKRTSPQVKAQWLNSIFYNNDFENELNFPLWFNDSFVKAHEIYKITKRNFKNLNQDSILLNKIPNEKIEYYFDPKGYVYRLVVYSYIDDREISRAIFNYENGLFSSGYRKVKALPLITLNKKQLKDQFATDFFLDATHQFTFYSFLNQKKKFQTFEDNEKKNHLFVIKSEKNWGALSVDSIVHPLKNDWIILGTFKKPFKRYQVENKLNESNIYSYQYWSTGVLKSRIKNCYPFIYTRSFIYDRKNNWTEYVDSTFSDNEFITRSIHQIIYDEFERPIEIIHKNEHEDKNVLTNKETLSYRSKNK